ncbi:helix-turn-helix domain-containing protein [Actinomadura sp. J1-007]
MRLPQPRRASQPLLAVSILLAGRRCGPTGHRAVAAYRGVREVAVAGPAARGVPGAVRHARRGGVVGGHVPRLPGRPAVARLRPGRLGADPAHGDGAGLPVLPRGLVAGVDPASRRGRLAADGGRRDDLQGAGRAHLGRPVAPTSFSADSYAPRWPAPNIQFLYRPLLDMATLRHRRRLGRELARLREARGLSQVGVAAALRWSRPTVGRIEAAQTERVQRAVVQLMDHYQVDGEERERLLQFAAGTPGRGWVGEL